MMTIIYCKKIKMSRTPNIEHANSSDGYNVRRPEEVTRPGERSQRRYDDVHDGRDSPGFLASFNPMASFQRMMDHMNDFFGNTRSLFGDMDKMFEDARHDPDGTHYVSSTSMCMLPGGVKEVKQRIVSNGKDVETHTRAIGDKYVSNKRERDIRTGREDVSRDLYDVKEHELDSFTRDFDDRMSKMPMRELFDRNRSNALFGGWDGYDREYNSHRALQDHSNNRYEDRCNDHNRDRGNRRADYYRDEDRYGSDRYAGRRSSGGHRY